MWMSYERLASLFDGEIPEEHGDDLTRAEYARLFVIAAGGRTAPLYASWYLDGELLGGSRQWVEQEYLAHGLELAQDAEQPADYLPCELEYLLFLRRHEQAAETTGDDRARASARRAQLRFLDEHLLRWLPRFVDRARAVGPSPLYTAALDSLERFVSEERARLVKG